MKELVLASQSPRRKEILSMCGTAFTCDPADADESIDLSLPLEDEIKRLALLKARTVLQKHPDAIVIGSDTTVAIDGLSLGKPKDEEDAVNMLRRLSGNTHQVITGLAVISRVREYTDVSVANVTFADLSEEEIRAYAASGECMDKAGSYAIQGYGGRFITRIEGDYYAIVGLPLHMVYEELKNAALY